MSAKGPMILTAALVGAETTRAQTPYLPISAEEIGIEAGRCREAGAAMVHLHVRKPDGAPSQDTELFRAAIREVRKRSDVLVQVSTGGAVGMSGDERCGALLLTGADKPDMATLSVATLNFGEEVFWNARPLVRDIGKRIRAAGLRPELELYDVGNLDEALFHAREGLFDLPAHFDFVLGVPGGVGARPEVLDLMRAGLPEGSTWTVAGIGRHQLPMAELAAKLGGHGRVGLEDNVYLSKGVLAKGSFELVAVAAGFARAAGRPLATPGEARNLLRLGQAP